MSCLQGFVGLQNIGFNCYANCIVQCLVAIPQMASFFLSDAPGHRSKQAQRPISTAFSHLLRQMWASKHSVVDPDRLADLVCVSYSGHRNQLLMVHHWCPPFMSTTGVHHSCPPLVVPFMSTTASPPIEHLLTGMQVHESLCQG